MALIEIKNASMGYEGKIVLSDINLKINEGDYVCIVGENGSGKTTLMKCLLGLLSVQSGSITYGDGLKQCEIGYLPQQTVLQKDFPASVSEVVLSGCLNKKHTLFYSKEQKETAAKNMELTGIYPLRKKCFRELSGGQRQAVALIMATMKPIDFLILDEHTAALDPKTADIIMELTDKVVREKNLTAMMVTHNLRYAAEYGDRLIMLDKGHIVIDRSGEEKKDTEVGDILKIFNEISIECGN